MYLAFFYFCKMINTFNEILLSTAYFPPIEYFAYLVKALKVNIEIYETYPKQTYRNRCKIYTANGVLALSIPVEKPSGNSSITKEIKLSKIEDWSVKHWRAIESAYNASPYFEYFKDELEAIFSSEFDTLIEFNQALINLLFDFIGLKKEISFTTDFKKEFKNGLDLRNHFNPKKENASFQCPTYYQVFDDKHGFAPNLSIIDLLFSEGPNTLSFLQEVSI